MRPTLRGAHTSGTALCMVYPMITHGIYRAVRDTQVVYSGRSASSQKRVFREVSTQQSNPIDPLSHRLLKHVEERYFRAWRDQPIDQSGPTDLPTRTMSLGRQRGCRQIDTRNVRPTMNLQPPVIIQLRVASHGKRDVPNS